ncbi:MAG TPA: hypothetical protein VMO52_07750 [Acidimicrobiia bacterium]|nr:hypothetical protein [Acidimicrobiia bacterium]
MQRVERIRTPILMAVALLALAAASMTTARFVADHPGADLNPIADAGELISLIQGQEHLFWSSQSGPVTQITVWGWPVSDGEVELGGGISITRLDGGTNSGIINTGDKPRAVSFEVEDL